MMRGCLGAASLAAIIAWALACGETRRPIGEECLRNEDCLSSVCAARSCVSAPPLVTGAGGPPPDEEPRIPTEGGSTPAPSGDAAADAE